MVFIVYLVEPPKDPLALTLTQTAILILNLNLTLTLTLTKASIKIERLRIERTCKRRGYQNPPASEVFSCMIHRIYASNHPSEQWSGVS